MVATAALKDIVTPLTRFLAACSYLPATTEGLAKQKRLLESACAFQIPPEHIWEGIQRHRIFALAERVLRTHSLLGLLGPHARALTSQAKECQLESLRLFAESVQLSAPLKKQGIAHHFLKGPLLSQKIYGNPGLRQTRDLDLQIQAKDVGSAVRLLQAEGWQSIGKADLWEQSDLYRWIAERRLRHFEFVQERKKLRLDLHWRIEQVHTPTLNERWWASWNGAGSDMGGAEWLYLCMHGASHGWNRLKWLGDVQAICDRRPGVWIETYKMSKELSLELIVAQTILLLQVLFEAQLDQTASEILERHPQAPEMAKFALESVQLRSAQFSDERGASVAYRNYLLKLQDRLPWQARLVEFLGLCLVDSEDLARWNRPAASLPAIPLIRALKLISRYCLNRTG